MRLVVQGDGLAKHLVTEVRVEAPVGYDFDASAERLFEIEDEACGKPRACCGARLHQKVHVAVRPVLTASSRAEQSNVSCPVLDGKTQYLVSLFFDELF